MTLSNMLVAAGDPTIYEIITAWGTLIAALVAVVMAVITTWWQVKVFNDARATQEQTRKIQSGLAMIDLEKQFDSEPLITYRATFASELLNSLRAAKADQTKHTRLLEMDMRLLNWFENVAYLTNQGVLDSGMVWNLFSWEVERYYLALVRHPNVDLLEEYRRDERQTEVYSEFVKLYKQLVETTRKDGNQLDPLDRIEQFLEEERALAKRLA